MSPAALSWDLDGRDWPNRESCRFVTAAGLRWLVLDLPGPSPDAPVALLLHGTGASTHSWRDLAPLLATSFRVVAPDLPGHGFTDAAQADARSLPGMARAVGALMRCLALGPALAIGHSAGAAILARMALDGEIAPKGIVSLNGAFLSFRGPATQFFSPIAKLLVLNPVVPWLFAWRAADRRVVERIVGETGSHLDPRGIELYARLASSPAHVAGALGMMAAWDLKPLERDLRGLQTPLYLVVGAGDATIRPDQAFQVRRLTPGSKVIRLQGLGHLAHEEQPQVVARLCLDLAQRCGALAFPASPASP